MIAKYSDPILILDNDERITDCNAEMLQLLNVAKKDFLHLNFDTYFTEPTNFESLHFYNDRRHLNIKDTDYRVIRTALDHGDDQRQIVILKKVTQREREMELCLNKSCQFTDIIEAFPQAVVIVNDGKIVHSNKIANQLAGDLEGNSIETYLGNATAIAKSRIAEVLQTQRSGSPITYEIIKKNGAILYAEMTPSFVVYEGKPSIMSVIRDVTYQKHDLNHAARMQQMLLKRNTPLLENMLIETVYVPSKTVSGDFYFFEQKTDGTIIGIVGDIRGKGVTAAMNLSAFEVIFRETVLQVGNIEDMISMMNKKVAKHMNDVYIAVILFSLDSSSDNIDIMGAGINEFYVVDKDCMIHHEMVKGPFLGMFEDLDFELIELPKHECRRLLFLTDGLEEQIESGVINVSHFVTKNLFDLANSCTNKLEKIANSLEGLHDDSSLVAIDFLNDGRSYEYVLSGISDYKIKVPEILMSINLPDKAFNIELVLMELLTNAYKYGNKRDPDLPIRLTISQYRHVLVLAVKDMGLTPKQLNIKQEIRDEELLEESGRGLFIVNQLSERIYVNDKSIIVEMRI